MICSVIFFRHEREEFLYKSEWDEFKTAGVLTDIIPAFSHDSIPTIGKMIFVQDKIDENQDLVRALNNDGCYYFFCGIIAAETGVRHALSRAIIGEDESVVIKKDKEFLDQFSDKNVKIRYSAESY
jgi:sulfite reductase alpha subunit-like flavoprotein